MSHSEQDAYNGNSEDPNAAAAANQEQFAGDHAGAESKEGDTGDVYDSKQAE